MQPTARILVGVGGGGCVYEPRREHRIRESPGLSAPSACAARDAGAPAASAVPPKTPRERQGLSSRNPELQAPPVLGSPRTRVPRTQTSRPGASLRGHGPRTDPRQLPPPAHHGCGGRDPPRRSDRRLPPRPGCAVSRQPVGGPARSLGDPRETRPAAPAPSDGRGELLATRPGATRGRGVVGLFPAAGAGRGAPRFVSPKFLTAVGCGLLLVSPPRTEAP